MRVMLWMAESTWSWLAWISSGDIAPVLAACTTRLLMFSSSEATSLSEPSAVAMTLLARCELSIAWLMPEISLRRPSLAIRPAGSSAPRLIRSPRATGAEACRSASSASWPAPVGRTATRRSY